MEFYKSKFYKKNLIKSIFQRIWIFCKNKSIIEKCSKLPSGAEIICYLWSFLVKYIPRVNFYVDAANIYFVICIQDWKKVYKIFVFILVTIFLCM